ncbi:unnamed protein product [Rotaria sp. Silwood1]|nr:unnamed protein product [Rotaria sp. Silwood1]CAF0770159.1 unnamed protein product [Rotaria sp. Silwood1]CAF3321212.1 unnamed protein product [Rotaria sp. Silwood1]CAF4543916.1 unnamed protein product [Rotaria sp. Silwood1]
MTLKDFNSKEIEFNRSKSAHQLTTSETNKRDHRLSDSHTNPKFQRIRTSFFNLLHAHRATHHTENKNIYQQQESLARRLSIIKSSDIAQNLEKKTVAFATTFDELDNQYDEDHLHSNPESQAIDDITSETDIVTVISKKEMNDEIPTDSNKNIEPYPFRSEAQISASSQSNSKIGITNAHHHHSRKNIIDRFTHHHHTKKLHPLPTVKYSSPNNLSKSSPNIVLASSTPTTSTKVITNDRTGPLKTVRTWLKSLPLSPFAQSTHKHSHTNKSSKPQKPQIARRSIGLRRFSELQY